MLATSPMLGQSDDEVGDLALVLRAGVLGFGALGLVLLVWWGRTRPYPPRALRPLRDVELAVATEAIDPSIDTGLLRVTWESVVDSRRDPNR